MSMIATLLPPQVASSDAAGYHRCPRLFPGELDYAARFSHKRMQEFCTVRACAGAALSRLGIARLPLVPSTHGASTWPSGVVGSMTHTVGYCAAAVARSTACLAVGIDAEPNVALPNTILSGVVASEEEERQFFSLMRIEPAVAWIRLLCSAKESLYKAWYPIGRRRLGFEAVSVALDLTKASFTASLCPEADPADVAVFARLQGRWAVTRGLILTTATVMPSQGR